MRFLYFFIFFHVILCSCTKVEYYQGSIPEAFDHAKRVGKRVFYAQIDNNNSVKGQLFVYPFSFVPSIILK